MTGRLEWIRVHVDEQAEIEAGGYDWPREKEEIDQMVLGSRLEGKWAERAEWRLT
jgi:hypothetical protein